MPLRAKKDNGTSVGVLVGQMRSSRRCADDTRRHRLAAIENFDVNTLRRHAQSREHFVNIKYGFSAVNTIGLTPEGPKFGPPGYEINLLYVAGLVALILGGAGPFVDRCAPKSQAAAAFASSRLNERN